MQYLPRYLFKYSKSITTNSTTPARVDRLTEQARWRPPLNHNPQIPITIDLVLDSPELGAQSLVSYPSRHLGPQVIFALRSLTLRKGKRTGAHGGVERTKH